MRNRQQLSSLGASNRYLIIKIDRSAALLVCGGLAFVAMVLVVMLRGPVVPANRGEEQAVAKADATMPFGAVEPAGAVDAAVAGNEDSSTTDQPADAAEQRRPAQPAFGVAVRPIVVWQRPLRSNLGNQPQEDASPVAADNRADAPFPTLEPVVEVPTRPAEASGPPTINGAGATFPYPLYSKWFDEFHKVAPEVQFSYQAVGSAAGMRQLLDKVVDFGGTDVPLSDAQLERMRAPMVDIPTVIGAVVLIYNLPGVGELRFTPDILEGIYAGRIVYWNDARIAAANRTKNLPDWPITVIRRSDGCATNFIFTDYLSKISREWPERVGKGTSVNWPVGLGGKGNEGVAGLVRQTGGAIGYVDFLYAAQNRMPYGAVLNSAGRFIRADIASLTAAGALPKSVIDFRVSITNAPGPQAYPISSFTWILAPVRSRSTTEGQDLRGFLTWALAPDSQSVAGKFGYAPLPDDVAARAQSELAKIH